jgi:hypothetical protein
LTNDFFVSLTSTPAPPPTSSTFPGVKIIGEDSEKNSEAYQLDKALVKFNNTEVIVGDTLFMPLPSAINLIPDFRDMASFTAVINDKVWVAPTKEQEIVGHFKL